LGPQLFIKGIFQKIISLGNIPIPYLNFKQKSWGIQDFIFGFSGAIDCAETDVDVFRSDYRGEYEGICETALARESGP
jgi:hypothetical protein